MGHPPADDDLIFDDVRDDGLPGWPLISVALIGLVITLPIWLPVCLVVSGCDQAWRGLVKRHGYD